MLNDPKSVNCNKAKQKFSDYLIEWVDNQKGKKDAMKDGLGNMGKGGKSSTGNSDVGALGKELAQRNVVNKSDFDYFKSN